MQRSKLALQRLWNAPLAKIPGTLAVIGCFLLAPPLGAQQGALPGLAQEPEAQEQPEQTISVAKAAIGDDAVEGRLLEIFASMDGLEGIQADVESGVVTLSGVVADPTLSASAEQLAKRVEGVVTVRNKLELDRQLSSRLDAAAEQLKSGAQRFVGLLPGLTVAALILVVTWLLARAIGAWDRLFERATPNPFIRDLVRQITKAVIMIAGVLLALEILNATALLGSIAGALGLVGLAIGIATRDTVENYIASILLSLRQPFEPHDHILVSDMEGIVLRLSSRATILMSLDGNHIRIPNSVIYKSTITNFTRNPRRRFEFKVGVDTDLDLSEPRRIALETMGEMPGVLDDPAPQCLVDELGDSSVILKVLGWVDQRHADFVKVRSEALRLVKDSFDEAGIVMPEPIYNINFRRDSKPPVRSISTVAAASERSALEAEIKPDNTIHEQIQRETKAGSEENLLSSDAPEE